MRKSICLCILACVAACQPRGASSPTPAAGAHAAASPRDAPIVANALQVTIEDALRTPRLRPSRFEDKQPAPGDSFLVLDVSVHNRGGDTRVFNAGPLVVLAGGKEHRVDMPENIIADGYLLLETLKPGSTLHGRVVYEVPADLDGPMYWLPGNGQRLRVQPTPTPLVTGAAPAQLAATQVPATQVPALHASTATSATHASPPAGEPAPTASTSTASTPRATTATASKPISTTTDAAIAPSQLRQLACRALVDNNDPAEQARYRDFFHQQCKGYRTPAAWTRSASTTRIARAAAPATSPKAHAPEAPQPAVAREAPEPKPQVVASDSGPSFDCAQAAGRAEQLVCADALLSLLDRELAQAVSEAERKVADPTALLRDQDDWRARVRDACQTLSCLERVYTQRTAGLRAVGGFAEVR